MSIENRMAAKKRAKQAQAKRTRKKILLCLLILMIPVIIGLIALKVIDNKIEKNAASDKYLNADGTIDAKAAKSYVDLCNYKNITVTREEQLPKESEVNNAVESALKALTETITDYGAEIEADSTVNLTYTVKVDGEELTDLAGTDKSYTLGNGTLFGSEFDDKIAALKVGDSISFDITFDADYSNDKLAGKTASFDGKVNSVNVVPQLTDALVEDKLATQMEGTDFPKTAAGFKDFKADELYKSNVESLVDKWITDNTKVKRYPYFYRKNQYYTLDKMYKNYVNQMNNMYGQEMYKSPAELLGLDSESEYKKKLKESSKDSTKYALAFQAIYEDAGLSALTQEELEAYAKENSTDYETMSTNYGANYVAQLALQDKVLHYVVGLVKEEGDAAQMWVADPAEDETTDESSSD